jgi:hypothetical protein
MLTKIIMLVESKSAWIIAGIVLIAIFYVLQTQPEKVRREIKAYCALNPNGTWTDEGDDFGGHQHSVDCAKEILRPDFGQEKSFCLHAEDVADCWKRWNAETQRNSR